MRLSPLVPRLGALPALGAVLALAGLAGCAQGACGDPDVLAYVDQASQSHDLYAVGLGDGRVRQTPLAARNPAGGIDRHRALCSAWRLRQNPAYAPGGHQPRLVRERQDFWVAKLASGYEVGLMPPLPVAPSWRAPGSGPTGSAAPPR